MRLSKTAYAAVAVSLSGSLALCAAGTALANPLPKAAYTAARVAAPGDTETTQQQFRVLERLGQLAELTGSFGRLAHDSSTSPLLLHALRERLRTQVRLVTLAVEKARPDRTLPAPSRRPRQNQRPLTLSVASKGFLTSVDNLLNLDRTNNLARTAVSNAMVRHLSAVNAAAMSEAGMPVRVANATAARTRDQPREAVTETRSGGSPHPYGSVTVSDVPRLTTGTHNGRGNHRDSYNTVLQGRPGRLLVGSGGVTDAVGDLVTDALRAPGGRLTGKQLAKYGKRLAQALAPLEQPRILPAPAEDRAAPRADAKDLRKERKARATAVADLRLRAGALRRAAARGDLTGINTAAEALTKSTADVLAAAAADGGQSRGDKVRWTGSSTTIRLR
jgi:hypothetical protein